MGSTAVLACLDDTDDLVLELEGELNGGQENTLGTKSKVVELVVELRHVRAEISQLLQRVEKSDQANAIRDKDLEARVRTVETVVATLSERVTNSIEEARRERQANEKVIDRKKNVAGASGLIAVIMALIQIIQAIVSHS